MTAEDVQRVAKQYFTAENRTVASYNRKAGTAAEEIPAELAALPPQVQQQVMAQIRQIRQIEDPAMLEQMLGRHRAAAGADSAGDEADGRCHRERDAGAARATRRVGGNAGGGR